MIQIAIKIAFFRKGGIICNSKDVVKIFNTFFVNIVRNLGIAFDESLLGQSATIDDPTVKITEHIILSLRSLKTHQSMKLIKNMQVKTRYFD